MTGKYSHRWTGILQQIELGLLVVTASNRQADFLRQQYRYFQKERQSHKKVWHKPAIYTDKQWLASLYQQFMIHHFEVRDTEAQPCTLITDQESQLIWEKIIEEDGDYLLNIRKTAETVRQASNRIQQWLLGSSVSTDPSFDKREETRHFKLWQQKANLQYLKNFWLEYHQLDEWLAKNVSLLVTNKNSDQLPEQIGLMGFQQISPARELLFKALEDAGISLVKLNPEPVTAKIYRFELADNTEEIKQAAIWARQEWQNNSQLRIGIVLPDLNRNREMTRIIFERLFCPSETVKSDDQIHRPFDISLGMPLSSFPLIDNVLMIMHLQTEPLSQDEAIQFLQSPYLSSANQQSQLALMAGLLRKSRQAKFVLKDLLYFASKTNAEKDSLLHIDEFVTNGRTTPGQWAIKLAELLEQMNWCSKRTLSSAEYQTREALYKMIDRMAIYDQLSGKIVWSSFKNLLNRTLHETLFQPKTGDCPIQIMGVLEAASLTFDKIRICGVDNRIWPDSARPNPFLPYELQKQHDMPNATAERELKVSKQLLQLLSNSAEEVIFSHGINNAEEILSVSPLLESENGEKIELHDSYPTNLFQTPAQIIYQTDKEIEYITDDHAPPISGSGIKGGSKLLQDIARCPFRAFAHHRINANSADSPHEDLDPLDRGNLVHRILERCWLTLFDKQQSELHKLHQSGQLEIAVEPYIREALDYLQQQHQRTFSAAVIDLEVKRLKRLLMQWFDMEIKRPEFTVKQLEQKVHAPIADNYIHIQLDRVDKLDDGSLAIIDYKTGLIERKNWFGERPDEPQLPLYTMVLADQQQTIGALLYGQVKTTENRFIGIAVNKSLVSGVTQDFASDSLNPESITLKEQIQRWREDLQSLMQEYLSGLSAVNPRDIQVCRYCDLHGLCRIGEICLRDSGVA